MSASKSAGSTHREDISMKLKLQNLRKSKASTKLLEVESHKMEERLEELKLAMSREKEQRQKNGSYWKSGRTGSLNSYAQNVLVTPTRDSKTKVARVRVLKDEPLDISMKENIPGTMGYIAQRGVSDETRVKGKRCGQCDVKAASLTCVQCSEIYCTTCFQAFHAKGALRKHRSVPIKTNTQRRCMSHWSMESAPEMSNEIRQSVNGVSGKDHTEHNNASERQAVVISNTVPADDVGASGMPASQSLLAGEYNEAESAASFQEALMEWRNSQKPVVATKPSFTGRMDTLSNEPVDLNRSTPRRVRATQRLPPVQQYDMATSSDDLQQPDVEVKFTAGLTYADRLLLKQHRRSEVPPLPPHRPIRVGDVIDEQFAPIEHLHFEDLFLPAVTRDEPPENDGRDEESLPHVEYIITDVTASDSALPDLASSMTYTLHPPDNVARMQATYNHLYPKTNFPEYIITDVSDDAHRKVTGHESSPRLPIAAGGKLTVKSPTENNHPYDAATAKFDAPNIVTSNTNSREVVTLRGKNRSFDRPKSRSQAVKSRSSSRAESRAASRLSQFGTGALTKSPSNSLHEVIAMATTGNARSYSRNLGELFVPNATTPERADNRVCNSGTKLSRIASSRSVKLSNRLYQMSPKSWRPDSSLAELLPPDAVSSNHLHEVNIGVTDDDAGGTYDVTDTAGYTMTHAVKNVPPTLSSSSVERVKSPHQSVTRSARVASPYTESKRTRHPSHPVCDARSSDCYDDDGDPCAEKDDAQALDQLEWELASQSGRITADGHISRMDILDDSAEEYDGSDIHERFSQLDRPLPAAYDINKSLSESQLLDDFEEMEQLMALEEQDEVKALH